VRYVAAATTVTPDGRVFQAGEEYDFPPLPGGEPETISELAKREHERNQEMLARLQGEPVAEQQRRGPGRPRRTEQ